MIEIFERADVDGRRVLYTADQFGTVAMAIQQQYDGRWALAPIKEIPGIPDPTGGLDLPKVDGEAKAREWLVFLTILLLRAAALQPVWTPADGAATVADAAGHEVDL